MMKVLQQLLDRLNKSLEEGDIVEITEQLQPTTLGIRVFASRQVFNRYLSWKDELVTRANAKALAANIAPLAMQKRSGDFVFQGELESGKIESEILYSYCKTNGTVLVVSI